jgi:hypothetical protein
MRAVLEHNYEWQKILDNALQSFTRKFCLILFTPFTATTREIVIRKRGVLKSSREINQSNGIDVPDLSFSRNDIESRLKAAGVTWELVYNIPTHTGYKVEQVFFIEKNS